MAPPHTASRGNTSPGQGKPGDAGILLDAGTNEAEILVFNVGTQRYGVNVAKVREVLEMDNITATPQSHPAVDGVVRVREWVVPVLNLPRYLGEETAGSDTNTLLLLEFNEELLAFRVDGVERIYRVNWQDTRPLPDVAATGAPVTGVIDIDDRLVQILDFEAITAIVSGRDTHACDDGTAVAGIQRFADRPIVLADDSASIRAMVHGALEEIGFTNIKVFGDGYEAWQYLEDLASSTTRDNVSESVAAVISDIEMPRMDGFRLTRQIRDNAVLCDTPVILLSSIVSKDNEKKGQQVGATMQISKPRYDELGGILVDVFERTFGENTSEKNTAIPPSPAAPEPVTCG